MITVENLLMAFASAYDAWLDPDAERKNPVPEYAALIRQAVNYENDTLGRTCEVVSAHFDELDECPHTWLSCGHHTMLLPDEMQFCPQCGAKVLEPHSNLLGQEGR